jgi:hypothetical protein
VAAALEEAKKLASESKKKQAEELIKQDAPADTPQKT